jgi:SAM-dependent methyltransferase
MTEMRRAYKIELQEETIMSHTQNMDLALVRKINKLWMDVYPGISRQIEVLCSSPPSRILEIGCFSGGIGLALLKAYPDSRLTVALEFDELAQSFPSDWDMTTEGSISGRIDVVGTPLDELALPDASFDLVVCRGIFFFLESHKTLLKEIDRVLDSGGSAFVGGGFGSYTSDETIRAIADESRELNYALGRKFFSREEFVSAFAETGIADRTQIVDEGGLWAVVKK